VSKDHELPCEEQLEAIVAENQHLREENSELLKASTTFGQLAERLSTELRLERRADGGDRRRESRPSSPSRRAALSAP
jgi:hypothetical protein